MKQVGRYSKFLFSIVFRRWSYYVATLIYLFVLCAILFLVSAVLKKPVSITLLYYGFTSMSILAGAITAAVYSTQLFRVGIDDGTELLITAKPIKRNEMLAGKCIVLFTLILILSIIGMCLGFLTYFTYEGQQNFTYIGAGVFITTFLVLLFFSGVTIVFCLITKKTGATLATIGTCFAFMVYSFVDTLLSKSPSTYVKNNHIDINPMSLVSNIENDKNKYKIDIYNGVIATNSITNTAIVDYKVGDKLQKANTTYLADVWHRALIGSSRYSMMAIDPIFQWSSLTDLQNYLLDTYQSDIYYRYIFNDLNMTNRNLKFDKNQINFENYLNWNIPKLQDSSFTKFFLVKCQHPNLYYTNRTIPLPNLYVDNLSNTIYLPSFNPNNPNQDINLEQYQISKTKWSEINNILFDNNNQATSIIQKYIDSFEKLIQSNFLENTRRFTTLSALQAYINNAFVQSLNNPTIFNAIREYANNEFGVKLVNISDFNELLNLLKNDQQTLLENMLFFNKVTMNTIMQIQMIAFNYLKEAQDYNDPIYANAMKILGIDSIVPSINTYYSTLIAPYTILEKLVELADKKIDPSNPLFIQLMNFISFCFMDVSAPPFYGTSSYNLATFTTVKVIPYISLGGLLGVWFSLTFILLVIGIILYSRKDFI